MSQHDSLDDQMTDAVRHMAELADQTQQVDRRGWTDQQWIADARQIMNEPHGSVLSLLNGHILAILRQLTALEQAEQSARLCAEELEQLAGVEAVRHLQERRDVIPPSARPRLKVLRSIRSTEHLPPHERIAEILDFLPRRDRLRAEQMIAGVEQQEARLILDQAIMDERL